MAIQRQIELEGKHNIVHRPNVNIPKSSTEKKKKLHNDVVND